MSAKSPAKAEIWGEIFKRKGSLRFQKIITTFKMKLRGLTWSTLKKNPSLIPLFAILGVGLTAATFYPLRCALKSPDVTWNRKKNPEPWNEYINKNYKFYQTERMKDVTYVSPPKY